MFPSVRILTLSVLICLCRPAQAEIQTAADLTAALPTNLIDNLRFSISGLVTCRLECRHYAVYSLEDETGSAVLLHFPRANDVPFAPGDRIAARGVLCVSHANLSDCDTLFNDARDRYLQVVSHGPAPVSTAFSAADFKRGALDGRPCRLTGVVRDFRRDELDPEWNYMVLESDGMSISIYSASGDERQEDMMALIGATITVDGLCIARPRTFRRKLGRVIHCQRFSEIKVVTPASSDPFDVPDITCTENLQPFDIQALGLRRLSGTVLATWHGDTVLLRTAAADFARVELMAGPAPAYGSAIEAAGYPETDLSQIILTRARWRPATGTANACRLPQRTADANEPFVRNENCVNISLHGQAVRVCGTVATQPSADLSDGRFLVRNEIGTVLVDASAVPEAVSSLQIGSEIEVNGTFVVESENWRRNSALPRITGFFVALRTPADLTVLARPPWWTPARLSWALGILLAVIVAILVWNATLRALVVRKSRALLKEQAEKLSETLKIDERTRLAAELHDYHSQNLTAISYQISAARTVCKDDPEETSKRLETAAHMLKSCRTDLRRCLWDLRNDTLNEPDFAEAIRRTVAPVAGTARLSVRFAGRRSQLSDSTAHALLSILRELTANARNHGHAGSIRIAGECRPGLLRFSIADDGRGFDPANRLGQDDGHFGLDGIRERLNRLGGTLAIDSAPGRGTYIRITINHASS